MEEGNRIRSLRAQFKRDVKAGERSVRAVLLADESESLGTVTLSDGAVVELELRDFATMRVVDLILPLRKVGRVKLRKILEKSRISPSKTLGGMTLRQRTELASWLVQWDNEEGGS